MKTCITHCGAMRMATHAVIIKHTFLDVDEGGEADDGRRSCSAPPFLGPGGHRRTVLPDSLVESARLQEQPRPSSDSEEDRVQAFGDISTASPSLLVPCSDGLVCVDGKTKDEQCAAQRKSSKHGANIAIPTGLPESHFSEDDTLPASSTADRVSGVSSSSSSDGMSEAGGFTHGPEPHVEPRMNIDNEDGTAFLQATRMIKNIPKHVTRDVLINALKKRGLCGFFDFLYMPVLFGSGRNFGYAFINMVSSEACAQLEARFQGFNLWGISAPLTEEEAQGADVMSTSIVQGLHANVERYRNSNLLHAMAPDKYKPVIFQEGIRVPFPPPTRFVKAPRLRPRS